ncbi:spore germination protein [Sporolactobacillus shoreicorticis]|uniref:GerAB/ArcD/ProY family transporter n=1 Tax=Sporolactobacillus shoreicorticis TaxID=1923877 RepID=A0ABW5S0M4_9BACL|nr:GerAB/ArcD/ProY family transporter [Sporolactobacillus shoreicorticis]MCO7124494.1 spore germination protein [Sporolactobacillus shoreicorticis]
MEKISKHQLFVLVMMEQIGSTQLWVLGIEAGRDAWLAILFSMLPGCLLIWVFTELQKNFPEDNITGIISKLLGKIIGYPLILLFALVDVFNSTRNISEFSDLLNMTFLQNTPSFMVKVLFLLTILYISSMGIETLARLTEIMLPSVLFFIILAYILIIVSGNADFSQLIPIMGNGPGPILKASYPLIVNFPFGLIFVFMQFWHFSTSQKSVRKITFLAVILSALLLALTQAIIVSTLGLGVASRATIPILEVIKMINIGDFITNLDGLGIILIFIEGFYMTIIHILSASMILTSLVKMSDYRWLTIPISIFILWYSGIYEPNYSFHVQYLLHQAWQQFVPLYNAVPLLLLIIYWLKKSYMKSNGKR